MLEDVLALFMARYGLKEPDDSEGCRIIQAAIAGTVTVAEVRQVLTTKYELYPHIEGQILTILDGLEETETSETASTDAAVVHKPEAVLPPVVTAPASTPRRRSNKR